MHNSHGANHRHPALGTPTDSGLMAQNYEPTIARTDR